MAFLEIFSHSRPKDIIGRDLRFAGYVPHYKILTGNIFGLILKNTMAATVMKSAYISLIIGPRGLVCQSILLEIMGWKSLMWSDLTLDPSFKVKRGEPNLKVLVTSLLLVLEVWYGKLNYRRSWAGNLLMWSDLTLDPFFKVK